MRLHTSLVLGVVILCFGAGRPRFCVVNTPPTSEHNPESKSALLSLRYRQALRLRLLLLAQPEAGDFRAPRVAFASLSPPSPKAVALPFACAPPLLQLLMTMQV
jgi:hypothetical protein